MAPTKPTAVFWVVIIAVPIVLLTYVAIADARWYYFVVVLLCGFFEFQAIRRLQQLLRRRSETPTDNTHE